MKNLLNKFKILQDELVEIVEELKEMPAGHLVKKSNYYYQRIGSKDIGITRQPELICTLCRKKYLLVRKDQLETNFSSLSKDPSKIDLRSKKELISSFPRAYQDLSISNFYHPTIKSWIANEYPKHPYPSKEQNYTVESGTQLRSKSEYLIASQLENYGLPYRYEAKLMLGEKAEYPDFTIKNPFTGKTILWEHFGALHMPAYEQKMNEKMNLYLKFGYIPFETLVYTFEFQVQDIQRLKELIEDTIL